MLVFSKYILIFLFMHLQLLIYLHKQTLKLLLDCCQLWQTGSNCTNYRIFRRYNAFLQYFHIDGPCILNAQILQQCLYILLDLLAYSLYYKFVGLLAAWQFTITLLHFKLLYLLIYILQIFTFMKFTQQQKAKFVGSIIKNAFKGVAFGSLAILLYYYVTAEKRGRERALEYERLHGKKKQTPLLSDQLQPEYIQQQKRKYRTIISTKNDPK